MGAMGRDVTTILPDGGRAGAAIRAHAWASTPLGTPTTWPASLLAHARALLHARQPMAIFWGSTFVGLYNDAFLAILGDRGLDAIGRPAREILSKSWPIVGPALASAIAGESVVQREIAVAIPRGGHVDHAWFNASYSPLFDDDGAIAGVMLIGAEVTEEVLSRARLERARREAEEARAELHGVFMQAPLPISILHGPDHRVVLANPPYLELVGRDVVGRTLREVFGEDDVDTWRAVLDGVMSTGAPALVRQTPLHLQESAEPSRERFIDIACHPHRDVHGAVVGILVLIHDVTEQVAARRALEDLARDQSSARIQADALRAEAESASRAKDEFLATVSHELRTPLTAILGWAQLLSQPSGRERLEKGISIIERNARAQAKLVDDILDVSRIVSGKIRLQVRPVDVVQVVEAAIESVRPAATGKGVRLEVDVAIDDPIAADEDRLQQIVWNLLSNAVKFTPSGGTVSIVGRKEPGQIRLVVRDTGRGIAKAFLPHVFERFRQGDASTTKHHAGLGLGLAIVRHLVELHGGTVRADSAGEDHGAAFEVLLPHVVEAPVVEPGPLLALASERMPVAPQRILGGLRILVVDDEQDARELVTSVLEDAGAEVVTADAVASALRILESTAVAAVVSDIGMPGEDGYGFVRRLRHGPSTAAIPAIALTAFARDEDRARAIAAGFQGHVPKPVDATRLTTTLATIVGR
jgi:signal transduction histidine kinase